MLILKGAITVAFYLLTIAMAIIGIVVDGQQEAKYHSVVKCEGTLTPNAGVKGSTKLELVLIESNLTDIWQSDASSKWEHWESYCTHVIITAKNATGIDWKEIKQRQLEIRGLEQFTIELEFDTTMTTEADFIREVGWKNFLFFYKFKDDDIWNSGIRFLIRVNNHQILSYDPAGEVSSTTPHLMIGQFIDSEKIFSDFDDSNAPPLKDFVLVNCTINDATNLPRRFSQELEDIYFFNVSFKNYEEFIKKCQALKTIFLKMNGEDFDVSSSLVSKGIFKIRVQNLTLVSKIFPTASHTLELGIGSDKSKNSNITEKVKLIRSLNTLDIIDSKFDKSFQGVESWHLFCQFAHMELWKIVGEFDLAQLSVCKELKIFSVEEAHLTLSQLYSEEFSSLQMLFLRNCTFDYTLAENPWKIFPNLTKFAIVSSNQDRNRTRPNAQLLLKAFEELPNLLWIHLTDFDWNPASPEILQELSKYLPQMDLDAEKPLNVENMILRRIVDSGTQRRWLVWDFRLGNGKEYTTWQLQLLSFSKFVIPKLPKNEQNKTRPNKIFEVVKHWLKIFSSTFGSTFPFGWVKKYDEFVDSRY